MTDHTFYNRLHNAHNPNQGERKKVLAVCSAGLLRSPTAAKVLMNEPFNFNARAAGVVRDYALVHADPILMAWADEIVCMFDDQKEALLKLYNSTFDQPYTKPIHVLNVPDRFRTFDPQLEAILKDKFDQIWMGKPVIVEDLGLPTPTTW